MNVNKDRVRQKQQGIKQRNIGTVKTNSKGSGNNYGERKKKVKEV